MINNFFKHWYSEYHTKTEKLRYSLLNIVNVASFITILMFSIVHLLNSEYILGYLQLLISVLILINIFVFRIYNKYHLSSFYTILLIYIQLMLLYTNGGINNTGIYWLMMFPILVLILKGRWLGVLWISLLIGSLVISIVLSYFSIIQLPYPIFNVLISTVCIFVITLMIYPFESLRFSYQSSLEKKNKETMLLNSRLEQITNTLSKYLSPQIYNQIFDNKITANVTTKRKKLTIFFSDIINFTSITDTMEPEDLSRFLNHYLDEMTKIAIKHGGTVDKFIGDAIMIFFGDPESKGVKQDAINCAKMSVEMLDRLHQLQIIWQEQGCAQPFNIRIGINTGYATVGNFGSENRVDYTIVGSAINLASRLESASSKNDILISEDTYLLIKDKFECIEQKSINVKGYSRAVKNYKIKHNYWEDANITLNGTGYNLSIQTDSINKVEVIEELEKVLQHLK